MSPSIQCPSLNQPLLKKSDVFAWAKSHYRDRTFGKDEQIPTRPGLIYIVEKGATRIVGQAQMNVLNTKATTSSTSEEVFLGFVGEGQPFEIVSQPQFKLEAYAHLDETVIIWIYWQDLELLPNLRQEIFETFRYQHQRKLFWLSILGQKRSVDRLMGFLNILIDEYGKPCEQGYYLPYPLTHSQMASAIGTTRVTVTRLMGKLRQQGLIFLYDEHLIGLPRLLQ